MTQPDNASNDTVGSVHELAVLSRIFPLLPSASAALLGPGDDAAVLAAPDGRFVVTTDMMVHGPDFRFAWSTGHDLGWKAAATNLADVAAMGARPTGLVVAIAATRDTPVSLLEDIASGLRDACAELAPGCGVVGGDMSVSDTFTLAITAFGDLEGRAPVVRSGARVGDVVALCGDAGVAATGLRLLFDRGVDEHGTPDRSLADRLRAEHPDTVGAQLAPRPPISAGVAAALGGATAMLDVSDGLALDARRIAAASGINLDLHSELLGSDPEMALRGGEDHALLATFPANAPVAAGFRVIGAVTEGSGVTLDGEPVEGVLGWDPYAGWNGQAG
ncbi:thiamine-phosphate kinase [Mycetocola zhadangensis]|uniref:thiamine-phosphate kinase n=1 Tax=Mycetocola zhadangensis TaxID=1164595 RepID=UPI003A4D410D